MDETRSLTTTPAGDTDPAGQLWLWADDYGSQGNVEPVDIHEGRETRSVEGIVKAYLMENARDEAVPRTQIVNDLADQMTHRTVDKWLKVFAGRGTVTRRYTGRTLMIQWTHRFPRWTPSMETVDSGE